MISLPKFALAAAVSIAALAGCNGILGIDAAHLADQDAGMMMSDAGMDVMTSDGSGGPCSFDNPNSQFDKGCTFAP